MKLVIISGLSGSGKSVALHALEDEGYYCIDNLHLGLLEPFVDQVLMAHMPLFDKAAVGIDARSGLDDLERFGAILDAIRARNIAIEVIFLQAEVNTLIKRFSETRRKHPLTLRGLPLIEAIHLERTLLASIADSADLVIDTTHTNVHQLRGLITERVGTKEIPRMSILVQSFGFKHGVPSDSDFVFDVRCLPNPHWEPELRSLTGQDPEVIAYLQGHPMVEEMHDMITQFVRTWIPRFEVENRSYLTISIGCTGGQHRSVYLCERLAEELRSRYGSCISLRHRELS
ncbi:MAG: RNase adapter RapZ [Gammaproteobacteria bacterium]|nr:MAG: RNase adapter RapZ [Gammaproteobacteria bacterium]